MKSIVRTTLLLSCFFPLGCDRIPSDGELLYTNHCAQCHNTSGQGMASLVPPLIGNEHLSANFDLLPCIIRHGISDTLTVSGKIYSEPMPGNKTISTAEIHNIVNYVNTQFAYNKPFLSIIDINNRLNDCQSR